MNAERALRTASEIPAGEPLLSALTSAVVAGGARIRTSVPLPLWLTDHQLVRTQVVSFTGLVDAGEHVALLVGPWPSSRVPLVRVHSECLTGDVCGPQLRQALSFMAIDGGVVLYLRQEGRGVGLYNKIDAYALQDQGLDTYDANMALELPADPRDFTVAAQMLLALGTTRCELLSNNPDKAQQLLAAGIDVTHVRATGAYITEFNRKYLETKVNRAGHAIDLHNSAWSGEPRD